MVSPRKSKSSLSLASEDRFKMNSSIKSCESIYSNATSKASPGVLYRRNRVQNPGVCQQPSMIPASTEVRQRVLSARRLKIKNYQNQLADAKQTIEDLMHENRMLQTLHKRQDNALAKYESSNAELPQLLNAHSEELRMWQTKFKNLQITNKDLEQKLKQKEALIMSLSDQNKYFSQLNKDKNLLDRQELREENDALKAQLKEKENELKLLIKKFQLEAKNFKQQMQNEQKKTKNALIELENFKMEVSAFNKIDQITTKVAAARPKTSKPSVKFDKTSENCSKPLLDLDSKAQPKMEKYLSEDSNLKKNKQKLLKEKCSNVISTKGNHTKEYDNNVAETENDFESMNDGYLNSDRCPSDNSFPDEAEMKLAEEEFKAIRLRTDISNIRNKILGDDYNKREQFIDGFCLKNNSQMNEEDILDDEDKYRKLSKA